MTFVIDTGTNLNIISKENFFKVLNRPKLSPSFINAFGFHSKTPVPILGEFSTTLICNDKKCRSIFLVLDGKAENLLGYDTARKLGLIEIKQAVIFQESNYEFIRSVEEKAFNPKEMFPKIYEDRIGLIKDVEVEIQIDPTKKLLQLPPYPIPLNLLDMTREKLMKMKADNVIEEAVGKLENVSPIHVVPKMDPTTKEVKGVRITSNNKVLNKAILMEKRWMPSVKTLTYALNGMKVFSKIDLRDAFNQILIARKCRHLTAFSTPWGVFWYCRLNMGLAISSELFQTIMTDILRDIPNQKIATDDIIVYGKDNKECLESTVEVLKRLNEVGATINPEKCEYLKNEITFYGYRISKDGMQPVESKIKDFVEMRGPRSFKDLHSFLGMAGYFAHRSPYQAEKIKCLRALLIKGGKWMWQEIHADAMESVKKSVIKKKLAHFNPAWITELIVDAGPDGCASFLTQVDPNDQLNRVLIHCQSHEFTAAEFNYSQVEKEAFACVWACYKDHLHLYGTRFTLVTDNIGCQKIFEEDIPRKKIPTRLEKLKSKLALYNAKVVYRPGKDNVADYLSRRSARFSPPVPMVSEKPISAIPLKTPIISLKPKKCKKFRIRAVVTAPIELLPYKVSLEEIALETLRDPVLIELNSCIGRIRSIKRNKRLGQYRAVYNELEKHETGVILRNGLILIPKALQERLIKYAHEGHLGIILCKRLLRNRCWWPGMDRMVKEEIKDCAPCQANTDTTVHEPLIPTQMPQGRLDLTSVDFSSQTPTGEYLLVVYYESGRLPVVKLSRSLTSEEAIRVCKKIFLEHGIPKVLKSDNGPAFKSEAFRDFAKQLGFEHRKVTPLNPEANGAAERVMGTINKAIRCAGVEKVNWKNTVSQMLRNYRATPHSATGISPDFFMTYKDQYDKIPTLRNECDVEQLQAIAEKNDAKAKMSYKKYADLRKHAKSPSFKIGDPVMLKWIRTNKYQSLFDPNPYRIAVVQGNMVTAERENRTITRNSRFFKLISEKCYEQALELCTIAKIKPMEHEGEITRILRSRRDIEYREQDVNIEEEFNSVEENNVEAPSVSIRPQQENRHSLRKKKPIDRLDENKNTLKGKT
jgi:transposase InsO family protein